MTMPSQEYVIARRVLLDALDVLESQRTHRNLQPHTPRGLIIGKRPKVINSRNI